MEDLRSRTVDPIHRRRKKALPGIKTQVTGESSYYAGGDMGSRGGRTDKFLRTNMAPRARESGSLPPLNKTERYASTVKTRNSVSPKPYLPKNSSRRQHTSPNTIKNMRKT